MKAITKGTYALTLIAAVLLFAALGASNGFAVSSLSDSSFIVPKINSIQYVEPNNGADIQSNVDSCPSTGCTIIIPPGTYFLTSPVVISKDSVHIAGSGLGTIISMSSNANYESIFNFDDSDYSGITNLYINGNRLNQSSGNGVGVLVNASSRFYANNLWIEQTYGDAMKFVGSSAAFSSHAAQLTNIKTYNSSGVGININSYSYDTQMSNVWIAYPGSYGIDLESGNNALVNIHVWSGSQDGIRIRSDLNRISNCYLEHNVAKGIDAFSANYNSIVNCNIWANGLSGVSFQQGNGNKISDSVFDSNGNPQQVLTDAKWSVIKANTFFGNGTAYGVRMDNSVGYAENNTIESNLFKDFLTAAITSNSTLQNSVLNNNYLNVTDKAILLNGIESYVSGKNYIVKSIIPGLFIEDRTPDGSVGLGYNIGSFGWITRDSSSSFATKHIAATINAVSNSSFGSGYDIQFNTTISTATPTEVFRVRGSGSIYLTPISTAPTSPVQGDVYVDTAPAYCWYNGSGWHNLDNRSNDGACA